MADKDVRRFGMGVLNDASYIKSVYEELGNVGFASKVELLDYINHEKGRLKVFPVKQVSPSDFVMEGNGQKYTFSWTTSYPMGQVIEDIVRAQQVLSGIEIEGVYNTPSLIHSLKRSVSLDEKVFGAMKKCESENKGKKSVQREDMEK